MQGVGVELCAQFGLRLVEEIGSVAHLLISLVAAAKASAHALYDMSQGRIDPYHFERTFGSPAVIARTRQLSVMRGAA
jgi:hypothetical protein